MDNRRHRDAAASRHAANVCLGICDYLSRYDAHIDRLAQVCECSRPSVRRMLYFLRDIGAPLRPVKAWANGEQEHYWRLDRPLVGEEAEAYTAFLFLPKERAHRLLKKARIELGVPPDDDEPEED